MLKLISWAQARSNRDEGQTSVEMGLVIGLVSLATAVILAGAASGWITSVSGKVTAAIAAI